MSFGIHLGGVSEFSGHPWLSTHVRVGASESDRKFSALGGVTFSTLQFRLPLLSDTTDETPNAEVGIFRYFLLG